jgi:sulfatase modifying factor 1
MLDVLATLLMTLLGVCPSDMAPVGWLVCMDRYEAPNIEGSLPMAMQSAQDGLRWCQERGRRLCTEAEWEAACRASGEPCHNDQQWRPWDRKTVDQASEIARLWQGAPSGSHPECRTPSGIYDLRGNVEEWVVSKKAGPHTKARDWPYTLKGGWWAKVTACGKTNDAHEPWFRFYETGFRCCK